MNKILKASLLFCSLSLSLSGHAHRAWLLPSSTVLSKEGVITVDAAAGNHLFAFDHVAMKLDNLVITGPDQKQLQPENRHQGRLRSSFDLNLPLPGTYRLRIAQDGIFASYKENGQTKRWRGNVENFSKEVPQQAEDLKVSENIRNNDTFVTIGKPTNDALKPSGKGLELELLSHPNDLIENEPASFRVLLDGKPVADMEVEVIRGGTRYRVKQEELKVRSDKEGKISLTWPQAGMYFMEIEAQDNKTRLSQAQDRRLSYTATFEVFPQ